MREHIHPSSLPKIIGGECKCKDIKCFENNIGPWNPQGLPYIYIYNLYFKGFLKGIKINDYNYFKYLIKKSFMLSFFPATAKVYCVE